LREILLCLPEVICTQNFVATQTEGMQFEKERVVILDAKGTLP
jgi:hypothetical protein